MEKRGRKKDRGRGSQNHRKSRKERSESILENIERWNYGNKGHMTKNCRALKKQRDGHHEKNQEANVIGVVLQNNLILFVDTIFESWEVDSGAYIKGPCFMPHPIGNIF